MIVLCLTAVEAVLSENGDSEDIIVVLCFLGDNVLVIKLSLFPSPDHGSESEWNDMVRESHYLAGKEGVCVCGR